ncbi:biogenesis of lysosome-related organelles complex 1 subunit 5-like [Watersipora subatra]|uniref:biogenesis of lysosome-related organelles complex 1 subunit 5-like n=1 Tax=Watersipora subatra TaxID=2589382 RepID=UPI00355B7AB1
MQSFPFVASTDEQSSLKGVSQVYVRLFGHHAVLQSEFSQMRQLDLATESGEQACKSVVEGLDRCTEKVASCDKELGLLKDINHALLASKQMCDIIIRDSGKHNKQKYLAEQRQHRDKEWETFSADIAIRKAEVEEKYSSDCELVNKQYEEAGQKLAALYGSDMVD